MMDNRAKLGGRHRELIKEIDDLKKRVEDAEEDACINPERKTCINYTYCRDCTVMKENKKLKASMVCTTCYQNDENQDLEEKIEKLNKTIKDGENYCVNCGNEREKLRGENEKLRSHISELKKILTSYYKIREIVNPILL